MANKVMIDAKMSTPTLAAIIERIENDDAIPLPRRKSTVTLLRAGARFLGKAPEQLPFDTTLLEKLAKVAPRRHKVGKGHLQNVRTAYRFALKHQGIELVRGRDTFAAQRGMAGTARLPGRQPGAVDVGPGGALVHAARASSPRRSRSRTSRRSAPR